MKKTIYLFVGAVTLLLAFSSCKQSTPDETLPFSTLTVEQQKQSIEQNGLDFTTKMEGLKKTQAFATLSNLGRTSGLMAAPMARLRSELLKNDVKAIENFNTQISDINSNFPDSIWGEWNWDKSVNKFKQTSKLVKKLIMHFPGDSLATTNNATLTAIYVESNVKMPNVNPERFMPQSLSLIIAVGGSEVLNAQFSGTYNSDATPISLQQSLVVGSYNWTTSLTNTSADVSANFTFKYNSDILLKYDLAAKGSFTANQINAVINDKTNTKGPQDIVTSGFMSFQIMNIVLYGGITDVNGFMSDGKALKYSNDRTYTDGEVAIFNKYLKFYGYFASEKAKFADMEFYTAEGQGTDNSKSTLVYTSVNYVYTSIHYDYTQYEYNSTMGKYVYNYYAYGSKTVYNSQPRFVLSDGSKVAIEDYVSTGFQDLINKINSYSTPK